MCDFASLAFLHLREAWAHAGVCVNTRCFSASALQKARLCHGVFIRNVSESAISDILYRMLCSDKTDA